MKTSLASVLFAGIMSCAIGTISANAADQKSNDHSKSAKMTCEDFIALDEVSRPKVTYWADGFNRYGQVDDETIDFGRDDRMIPILVEECTKNPKHSFVSKVKAHSKKTASM